MKDKTWQEYTEFFNTDSVYFLNEDESRLYVIVEGDGSNLFPEDDEEGYVDYWMTYMYDVNEKKEIDGGQWLETEYISKRNYTIGELIDRMKECDAPADLEHWTIQLPEVGERVQSDIENAEFKRIWRGYGD